MVPHGLYYGIRAERVGCSWLIHRSGQGFVRAAGLSVLAIIPRSATQMIKLLSGFFVF